MGSVLSQPQPKAWSQALPQPLSLVVSFVLIDNPAREWVNSEPIYLGAASVEALNIRYPLEDRRNNVKGEITLNPKDPRSEWETCPFLGSHYDPDSWAPVSAMTGTERKSNPWVRDLLVSLPLPLGFSGQGYTDGEKSRHPDSHVLLCRDLL